MTPFNLPSLDLTILEAIRHNETHNIQCPIFRYNNEDGCIQSITWGEAGRAFTRASHFISENLNNDGAGQADAASPVVVGVLANLDSITFISIIIGIMRAGFVPFLISPRNSPEAVAHLMTSTRSKVLLISEDPVINELARTAIRSFKESADSDPVKGPIRIRTLVAPSFEQLYGNEAESKAISMKQDRLSPIDALTDDAQEKWDRLCVIVHSSGTTSLPKPISLTHRMIQQQTSRRRYDEDNYVGSTLAAHAVPVFRKHSQADIYSKMRIPIHLVQI
jgi:acyl-CoA synthetase (AMP-forming)/AMP-acid ligase II